MGFKITLVDFNNSAYTLYARNMTELDKCADNLKDDKWKAFCVQTIKSDKIDVTV